MLIIYLWSISLSFCDLSFSALFKKLLFWHHHRMLNLYRKLIINLSVKLFPYHSYLLSMESLWLNSKVEALYCIKGHQWKLPFTTFFQFLTNLLLYWRDSFPLWHGNDKVHGQQTVQKVWWLDLRTLLLTRWKW